MRPLRGLAGQPALRPLLLAQFVSLAGTHVTAVALPTLAVLHLNASPLAAAVLFALEYGARGLTAPLAGVLVDGVRSPRRLLVGTDLLQAFVVGTVPVAYLLDSLTWPYLVVVAGISGTLAGVTDLSITAVLPRLVPADRLVAANSSMAGARAVGQIAGPALGGLLVQALGAGLAVAVDAVSYLGSAAVLGRLRAVGRPERAGSDPGSAGSDAGAVGSAPGAVGSDPGSIRPGRAPDDRRRRADRWCPLRSHAVALREGLSVFGGTPWLARLALAAAALNLGGAGLGGLYAFTAYRLLGLSPAQVGLTFAAYSAAAIVAVASAARVIGRLGLDRASAVLAPVAAGALSLIPLATLVAPLMPAAVLPILVGYQLVFGFCATVWTIAAISTQQRLVPVRLVGRVVAVSRTLSVLAIPLGAGAGGLAASWLGLRPTLIGFAVLAFAGTAVVVSRPTRSTPSGTPAVVATTGHPQRGGDHVVDGGQQWGE